MQKLLTMVIIFAIAYKLLQAQMSNVPKNSDVAIVSTSSSSAPESTEEIDGNIVERSLSKIIVNTLKTPEGRSFFENMIRPLNQPLGSSEETKTFSAANILKHMLRESTTGDGTIGPISCGNTAKIKYHISTMEGNVIENGEKTFRLGSGAMIPALENLVVGMKVGQTREGIAIPQYAYDIPKFQTADLRPGINYKIQVTLLEITPQNFAAMTDVRTFDDTIAYQIPLLCGQRISFDIKISNMSGNVLYDSEQVGKKIDMYIGDDSYPILLSHALFGKLPGGTRTVITKSAHLEHAQKIFGDIKLPKNEFLLIDFKNTSSDGMSNK